MTRNVRVVMAKLGLDIHWRGVYLVAQFLKDAGMEVVFLGNQFPEQIVEAALEEDADIVGLSSLSGNHMTLAPKVVRLLREKGLERVKVYMGGVMAPEDAAELERAHGIHKVFLPDTPMQTIVDHMYASVGRPRHQP